MDKKSGVCLYVCIYTYTCVHVNIYTHNGILLAIKKNEILPFVTTNGLQGHDAKWNRSDRERQILDWSLLYEKSYKQ